MPPLSPAMPDAPVPPVDRQGFVDVFRGLLIAHMALDHASMMFNSGRGGEELWRHQPALQDSLWQFLTRFTGVPVAPGFCFMAGFMVAWTSASREGRGVAREVLTRRLLVRGLVLIGVDTLIGGLPRLASGFYSFMVLSCIGVSIMLIALLRHLSSALLLSVSLAILALHPLLDVSGLPLGVRLVLYEPVREGHFRSMYPLIPWFGLVLLGFVVGRDALSRKAREGRWLAVAAASLGLFFAVRFTGLGNAYPQAGLTTQGFWWFSKYPPDLPFLTWALAWVFGGLALVHRLCRDGVPRWLHPFVVYGRVSFFFYVVHFYLLGPARGIAGRQFGLGGTLVVWLVLLAVMYWLSAWYHEKKEKRPNLVTRYL